ncbi:DNA-processing protein DprA [Puia sp.]|uniref:DNA-processing protein DprA n=1 Tax=Puia sp. TaxID=2045100 RepID=UPI002F41CB33
MEAILEEEALYRIALTRIPGIGPVQTKKLIAQFGNAVSVFRADPQMLRSTGLKEDRVAAIAGFCGRPALEAEVRLLGKKGVRLLFFTDPAYPSRLNNIPDSPSLLFYRGNADLNADRIVAVIGTRRASDYGRQITAQLIRQIAQPGLLIISGLALGIDTAAHEAALNHHLPTVGILGHGFGHLYPPENRQLAKSMICDGGLLTSFGYGVKPEGYRFPDRNEIVAGLCDALVVVETARRGGSLLTVETARKYGRKIFAVPGRVTDPRSSGCNWLIRQEIATLLTSGDQLQAMAGWKWPEGGRGVQTRLRLASPGGEGTNPQGGRPDPEDAGPDPEDSLLQLLKQRDCVYIDEIAAQTGLAPSSLALLLLKLELQGLISVLPGKRYKFKTPAIRA